MRVWQTEDGPIVSLAFSPDGRRLAAAGRRTLRVWTLWDETPAVVIRHRCWRQVAFTPDGRSLIADNKDGEAAVFSWNADTGERTQLATANGHTWTFTFDPARRLAVYSNVEYLSNDLQWYSFEAGAWVDEWADLAPTGGDVFRFSPDGLRLALPSYQWLGVCDLANRTFLDGNVELAEGPQVFLAYSPDGSRLVCGAGRRLTVCDPATLTPVAELRSGRHHFSAIAFHPSGRQLAATTQDGVVHLYDAATWQRTQSYNWGVGRLKCVAYNHDGTLAAAGSEDGRLVVWDVEA